MTAKPRIRRAPARPDTVTILLRVRFTAPAAEADRVNVEALAEHMVVELENAPEYWPDPDHDPKTWEPAAGYTIESVAWEYYNPPLTS